MIHECICRCLSDIVISEYGFEQYKLHRHCLCINTFSFICVFNSYFSINTTFVLFKFYVISLSVQLPVFFFILHYFVLCPLYPHFLNLIFPRLFSLINNPHSPFRNMIFNFLLSLRLLCFVWM